MEDPDIVCVEVEIADLTRDGFRLVTDYALPRGRIVELHLTGVGVAEARVIWHGTNGYGCRFLTPLPPGAVTAATRNNMLTIPKDSQARDDEPLTPDRAKWSPRRQLLLILGLAASSWTALVLATYALLP